MTAGLCECGCGERTNLAPKTDERKGWIKGQPVRFIAGHHCRTILEPGRAWLVEDRGHSTPCWTWSGVIGSRGYGVLKRNRRKLVAHRVVYERLRGPIPDGLTLDHLCRNRDCVNPEHLDPVTMRENLLRGFSPFVINSRRTHCANGHPLSGENLFIDTRGYRGCRTCRRDRRRACDARRRVAA